MKLQYQRLLKLATGLAFLAIAPENLFAQASPSAPTSPAAKVRVGVAQSQDRWVTLTNGQKIYNGIEISYLLGQTLFDSANFIPYLVGAPVSAPTVQGMNTMKMSMSALTSTTANAANTGSSQDVANRIAQIPAEWTTWLQNQNSASANTNSIQNVESPVAVVNSVVARRLAAVQTLPPISNQVDVVITPQVEALVYASGARSDRITFGFSPNHINPFNAGTTGALDNDYVASPQQIAACQRPDFFNGSFTPQGSWHPSQSNFGADMDEGFILSLFGFSIGYKKKAYTVGSQIRFYVDDLRSGAHKEFVYKITASGKDQIMVFGIHGVSLSLEMQQAQTLSDALKTLLPQAVNQLLNESFIQNLVAGSTNQNLQGVDQTQTEIASSLNITLPDGNVAQTAAQSSSYGACYGQASNSFKAWLESFFEFVGLWRYDNVLDQPYKGKSQLTVASPVLKIGLIDSGIDYNDSTLQNHVIPVTGNTQQVLGFDFISWDNRPSDDNGHGSAAAKFLATQAQVPFAIVPIKVIGAFAQTQSGAIYDGFVYAVQNKVDAIVVPWSSSSSTMTAYQEGAILAARNGIPVFVEAGSIPASVLANYKLINMPTSNGFSEFNSKALGGASVRLDAAGVATIAALANWMNAGGTYASH